MIASVTLAPGPGTAPGAFSFGKEKGRHIDGPSPFSLQVASYILSIEPALMIAYEFE